MTTLDGIPLFKGEAMLLSWGDTSSRGKTVTFALHEDDCGTSHPFRDLGTGRHGQRFQIVAVPITDDGNPIPPGATTGAAIGSAAADHPPPPERSAVAPGGARKSWYEQKPSQRAGILCNEPEFARFLEDRYPALRNLTAVAALRELTEVHSRRQYDIDPAASARFEAIERSYRESRGLETASR